MITVSQATKIIVERSRYLSEAMSKNLINISSLARYIRPEVEEILVKDVSESSIIMALKRLQTELKPQFHFKNVFVSPPDIVVRSNISLITAPTEMLDQLNLPAVFAQAKTNKETTCLISGKIDKENLSNLGKSAIYAPNLSSISIALPANALHTPGVLYFFLKSIAWEGLNIVEVISTTNEFVLLFEDKDIHRAFSIIKSLFSKNQTF